MNYIKVQDKSRKINLAVDEIMRIEAMSSYSRLFLSNGKIYVVAKVLHWFESRLPDEMFTRVHRSHLVNKMFIAKIKGNRSKALLLFNGESIAISRRKNRMMIKQYNNLVVLN